MIFSFSGCDRKADEGQPLEAGITAPDFRAEDLTGMRYYLNALRGKPVLLTFFATWCEPCKAEIPLLTELARSHGDRVQIVCIVTDTENKEKARAIADALAVPYPMLMDDGEKIKQRYGVSVLPASFLIDSSGLVRSVYGALEEEDMKELRTAIEKLAAKP